MALVHQANHRGGLTTTLAVPYLECSKSLSREETSSRKEILEKQRRGFDDILFLISVSLEDMRRLKLKGGVYPTSYRPTSYYATEGTAAGSSSRGAPSPLKPGPPCSAKGVITSPSAAAPRGARAYYTNALTVIAETSHPPSSAYNETSVWFPQSPPRGVPAPRPIQQQIPKTLPQPLARLLEEESELREWVDRLEAKLRAPIERECVDTWMILTGPPRLEFVEYDEREELQKSEEENWRSLRTAFRKGIPLSFLIDRWRGPHLTPEEEERLDPIGAEEKRRLNIIKEEKAERKAMHAWLCEMYGVRLFSTSRVEVGYRCEFEEEEKEAREMILERLVRQDFRWPLLATLSLHCTKSPTLGWMLSSLKREQTTATEAGRQGAGYEEL